MDPGRIKLLEEAGIVVICESPLELHHPETGSIATGIFAQTIVYEYTQNEKEE